MDLTPDSPSPASLSSEELVPIVYADLKRIAARFFESEPTNQTLQPTALVNEAYLRVAGQNKGWANRAQFLAIAARSMRRVLVDAARRRGADKRANGALKVTLFDQESAGSDSPFMDIGLLDLEEALERLGQVKPRYLQQVELRFFGGLSFTEAAQVLGISRTMVVREWAMARAWLLMHLADKSS